MPHSFFNNHTSPKVDDEKRLKQQIHIASMLFHDCVSRENRSIYSKRRPKLLFQDMTGEKMPIPQLLNCQLRILD
jgi:hypothetical protein